MKVRYSTRALIQLEQIHDHIARRNPRAASTVTRRIKRSVELLADFPFMYRQTRLPEIRVLPVVRYPYLVFYTVDEAAQEVTVLRIRHSARDPDAHVS